MKHIPFWLYYRRHNAHVSTLRISRAAPQPKWKSQQTQLTITKINTFKKEFNDWFLENKLCLYTFIKCAVRTIFKFTCPMLILLWFCFLFILFEKQINRLCSRHTNTQKLCWCHYFYRSQTILKESVRTMVQTNSVVHTQFTFPIILWAQSICILEYSVFFHSFYNYCDSIFMSSSV